MRRIICKVFHYDYARVCPAQCQGASKQKLSGIHCFSITFKPFSPFVPDKVNFMTQNQFFRANSIPAGDLEKIVPLARDSAARREPHLVAELAKLLGASLAPAFRLLIKPSTLRQWRRLLREGIDP